MRKTLKIVVAGVGIGILIYFLSSFFTLKGMSIVCSKDSFDLRCLFLRISPEPLSLSSNCEWVYTQFLDCRGVYSGVCASDFRMHCGRDGRYPEVTDCEFYKDGQLYRTYKYCSAYTVPAYSNSYWIMKGYRCEAGCDCSSWRNVGCGESPCSASQMKQVRDCNPSGCDDEVRCVTSSQCVSSPEGVIDLIFKGPLSLFGVR